MKGVTLVRTFTLWWLQSVFLGSHLQSPKRVGFKAENVVAVPNRIWQGFFINVHLTSSLVFKGIIGSNLLENPFRLPQPWEKHRQILSKVDMGALMLV